MKKSIIFLLIIIIMTLSILYGCQKESLTILYLGDSIGEALAGPTPVSERERYGYYGVVGLRNNYYFINRSVSTHRSADMLNLITQEEKDIRLYHTNIANANIIHISILGNDLLRNGLQGLLLDAVKNDYSKLDAILQESVYNFSQIVATIKQYNPNAVILFQNVYNPVYPDTALIDINGRTRLAEQGVLESSYRDWGAVLLTAINSVISDYLEENPGAFHIIDAYKAFNTIFEEDPERGKSLIFPDGVHPSNEGHAVMADTIQLKLEELGLANRKTALRNYKALRIEQLERMYSDSIDIKTTANAIKKADSCSEVTKTYFDAIRGIQPIYYKGL